MQFHGICSACGGPYELVYRYDEDDQFRGQDELSPFRLEQVEEAIEAVTDPTSAHLFDQHSAFSHDVLDPIVGERQAGELLQLVEDVVTAARSLHVPEGADADVGICQVCEGPAERLYDRDGNARGWFPRRAPAPLLKAIEAAGAFRAPWTESYYELETTQARVGSYPLSDTRDGERPGAPDTSPFFSERFLYVTFDKDNGRSILYSLRQLACAAGCDPRVVRRAL